MRIYIIGNSCSGKSTLAKKLSKKLLMTHHDLDHLFWSNKEMNQLNKNRFFELDEILDNKRIIIEGVYKSLESRIIKKTDILIFLNVSKEENKRRLLKRHKDPQRAKYIQSYYDGKRFNGKHEIYSRVSHLALFDSFKGFKINYSDNTPFDEVVESIIAFSNKS
jgi:adenylate kinase family enzyme